MRIGFLVNPIAGMGGKVGLKGTDSVFKKAVNMGAKPVAPERGTEFLKKLKELGLNQRIQLITCPATMGEEETCLANLDADILSMEITTKTTAEDTKKAVKLMTKRKIDLILFVGGDGTARDILDTLQSSNSTPVLGVPSGVKMYSGIFAINPIDAAYIVEAFIKQETQLDDFEIIDADETAIRNDQFNIRLYGFLKGPFLPMRIQGSKQVSPETLDEHENQVAVARFIIEEMNHNAAYILGPGTTVKCVADLLGVEKTLLGVDIYRKDGMTKDVNEEKLLKEIDDWQNTWIIVSPIGRQGILFGRGNLQISQKIIRLVGKDKILVLATRSKIRSIEEGVLRVDTGDAEVDRMLRGYIRVATDYREWRLLQIR
ncbi:MAG: ATP-NAD kinase family protein [Candidatus Bathyarchaeota archaeon]|nr:ATP-NAD kinase family protein [Candidatus Bathyarchaeota archaeon]MDH5494605.1 ATP-NAD kinase family protein [Candidatus Bathyarchaeota archaeon]